MDRALKLCEYKQLVQRCNHSDGRMVLYVPEGKSSEG